MARRRRRYYFRKRHSSPEKVRRPVTTATKITYIVSIISILFNLVSVAVAVAMDGQVIKVFAGLGFCFLLLGIYLVARSVSRIKSEDEPLGARVMAVVLSSVSIAPWVVLYVVGMMNE